MITLFARIKQWIVSLFSTPVIVPPVPIHPPVPAPAPVQKTLTPELYTKSKSLIRQRLRLDKSVPDTLACATALSYVIHKVKFTAISKYGISGTNALLDWFLSHPELYKQRANPTPGCIILSPTGHGNGKIRGHVGIEGNNSIMSNNSKTGLWDTHWDSQRWYDYYTVYGGIKTYYFELL